MRTPGGPGRSVALSIGRMALLVVALAGLFAMHGMSEHGVAGRAMDGMSLDTAGDSMSSMTMSAMPGPIAHVAATSVDTQRPTEPVVSTPGHDSGGMAAMAMGLCLAVVGVGVLLWRLRAGRWRTGLLHQIRSRATRAPRRARATDPPDLYRLSIQRC